MSRYHDGKYPMMDSIQFPYVALATKEAKVENIKRSRIGIWISGIQNEIPR